jgi:hypothetical protein
VFFFFKDESKHDMQNLWPHAVIETFVDPGTSKHTAQTSASSGEAAAVEAAAVEAAAVEAAAVEAAAVEAASGFV